MRTKFIKLARTQIEELKPFMKMIDEMAATGKKGMCLAQVFDKGMEVGVLNHKESKKFINISKGMMIDG